MKPVGHVQGSKFSRARVQLERQAECYKEKLRRTCAKLTEVLALYQQVRSLLQLLTGMLCCVNLSLEVCSFIVVL